MHQIPSIPQCSSGSLDHTLGEASTFRDGSALHHSRVRNALEDLELNGDSSFLKLLCVRDTLVSKNVALGYAYPSRRVCEGACQLANNPRVANNLRWAQKRSGASIGLACQFNLDNLASVVAQRVRVRRNHDSRDAQGSG